MLEVVGYGDKAKRDERYQTLKRSAVKNVVKFSDVERLSDVDTERVYAPRRHWWNKRVLVRERVVGKNKSRWRTLWCVAFGA